MLAKAHIEVMPLGSLEDQLQHLAAGSTITVTCSPKRGIDATLRVAALLSERGLDAVPHIAARQVRDENHLKRILDTLNASAQSPMPARACSALH